MPRGGGPNTLETAYAYIRRKFRYDAPYLRHYCYMLCSVGVRQTKMINYFWALRAEFLGRICAFYATGQPKTPIESPLNATRSYWRALRNSFPFLEIPSLIHGVANHFSLIKSMALCHNPRVINSGSSFISRFFFPVLRTGNMNEQSKYQYYPRETANYSRKPQEK